MRGRQHVVAIAARHAATVQFGVDRAECAAVRGEFRGADEALLLTEPSHALAGLHDLPVQCGCTSARDLAGGLRLLDPDLSGFKAATKRRRRLHVLGPLRLVSFLLCDSGTRHHYPIAPAATRANGSLVKTILVFLEARRGWKCTKQPVLFL